MSAAGLSWLGWLLALTVNGSLAVFGGAWLARALMGQAVFGAVLGAGNLVAAAVTRARHQPNRAERYFAALLRESPQVQILELIAWGFAAEILAGAVGALLGAWVPGMAGPRLGGMIGAGAALTVMLHKACVGLVNLPEPDHGDAFGGARWSTLAEVLDKGLSRDTSGGMWAGIWCAWTERRAKWWHWWQTRTAELIALAYRGVNSCLTIGPAGTGKFAGPIASMLLSNSADSIIMLDMKGEGYGVTASQRRRFGQKVVLLNPYGAKLDKLELPPSDQVNLLGELDMDQPGYEVALKNLANILCPISEGDKNKHFSVTSQGLTMAFMGHCRETMGETANLPLVAQWLHEDAAALNRRFEAMRHSRFAFVQDVGNEYHVTEQNPYTNAMRDVMSTARGEISWLSIGANRRDPSASTEIARLFAYGATGPVFSFRELKTRKVSVFIILTPQSSDAFKKLNKLLIAGAMQTLNKPPHAPTVFILDEMANALPQEAGRDILALLNTGRYVGLRLSCFCQNWGQVVEMFGPGAAQTVRGAMGLLTFFGANDPETCDFIKRECGKKTIWQPSSNPAAEYGVNGGVGATGVEFISEQRLREMMGGGQQISFLLGHGFPALMQRQPFYFDIPELAARADDNPCR